MSSSSSLFVYKKGIVNQDVWNHIVFIVDKSNYQIKIFQNGELIDTKSDVHIDIPTHFDKMQIGYDEKSDTHIHGKLDDLYIFNRTLTEYDVKRLYQEKFENQLLLRYDFENIDDIKQIIYDSSGYLNDATVFTDTSINSILHSNSWDTTLASNTYGVIQDNNTTILGTMLEKCTFSAWVNLNNLNTYQPILSRGNIFRFGLHYGQVILCLGDGVTLYPLPKLSVPGTLNNNNVLTTTDNDIKNDLLIDFSKQDTLDDIVKLYNLEVISGNETELEIQQIDENNIIVSNTIQITSSPPSSVSDYSVKNILNDTIMWKSNSHTGSILFDFSSVKTINKIEILNDLTSDFTGFSKLFIHSTNDKNDLPTKYSFGHDTYPMGSEESNFTTVYEKTDEIKKHISISNIQLETQYMQFWFQTNDISYILSVNQIKMYTYSSSSATSTTSFVNSSLFPGNIALQLNNSILEIKSPNTLTNFSFFAWYNLKELNEQILFQSNSLKLTVTDTGSLALQI